MNLFRSEEHVRNWSKFRDEAADGTVSLAQAAQLSAAGLYSERLSADYLARRADLARGFVDAFAAIGKTGPYWIAAED